MRHWLTILLLFAFSGAQAAGPQLISAELDGRGGSIYLKFDSPTNKGGLLDSFLCPLTFSFDASIGLLARCHWLGDTTVRVDLGILANIGPGNTVSVVGNLIKDLLGVLAATGTAIISLPAVPVPPIAALVGPSYIGNCGQLTLHGTPSGGSARSLLFSWSVSGGSPALSSFVSGTPNSTLVVPYSLLPSNVPVTFSLGVTNFLGVAAVTLAQKVVERVTGLALPLVSIINQGPLSVLRPNDLLLQSKLEFPSCINASLVNFAWTQLSGPSVSGLAGLTSPDLLIPAYSLQASQTYSFRITATLNANPSLTSSDTIQITVGLSAPTAVITGANRALSTTSAIAFDALASIDHDQLAGSLSHSWNCTNLAGTPCINALTSLPLSLGTSSTVSLPAGSLAAGTYKIFLTVKKGTLSNTVFGALTVILSSLPLLNIGTSGDVNPTERVLISVTPDDGLGAAITNLTWSVVQGDVQLNDTAVLTSLHDPNLVIAPNVLSGGTEYRLRCTATDGVSITSTDVTFTTLDVPYGGIVLAVPSTAESGTIVTLTTVGWLPNNPLLDPLVYRFSYLVPGSTLEVPLSTDSMLPLSVVSFEPLDSLPVTVTVICRATTSKGVVGISTIQVTVLPPSIGADVTSLLTAALAALDLPTILRLVSVEASLLGQSALLSDQTTLLDALDAVVDTVASITADTAEALVSSLASVAKTSLTNDVLQLQALALLADALPSATARIQGVGVKFFNPIASDWFSGDSVTVLEQVLISAAPGILNTVDSPTVATAIADLLDDGALTVLEGRQCREPWRYVLNAELNLVVGTQPAHTLNGQLLSVPLGYWLFPQTLWVVPPLSLFNQSCLPVRGWGMTRNLEAPVQMTPFYPAGCEPLTCAEFEPLCGTFDDGCRGTLSCPCPTTGTTGTTGTTSTGTTGTTSTGTTSTGTTSTGTTSTGTTSTGTTGTTSTGTTSTGTTSTGTTSTGTTSTGTTSTGTTGTTSTGTTSTGTTSTGTTSTGTTSTGTTSTGTTSTGTTSTGTTSTGTTSTGTTSTGTTSTGTTGCTETREICQFSTFLPAVLKRCGVFQMSAGDVKINSGGSVDGDACIASNAKLTVNGGGYFTGDGRLGANVALKLNGGSYFGGSTTTNVDWTSAANTARALSTSLTAMSCTQTFSQLNKNMVIMSTFSTGGANVICVTGKAQISGGGTFTIVGTAGDTFVFNVHGDLTQNGGVSQRLTGGVKAENVIWNIVNGDVQMNSGCGGGLCASVQGTVLVTNGKVTLNGGSVVNGSIIVSGGADMNGGSNGQCPHSEIVCTDAPLGYKRRVDEFAEFDDRFAAASIVSNVPLVGPAFSARDASRARRAAGAPASSADSADAASCKSKREAKEVEKRKVARRAPSSKQKRADFFVNPVTYQNTYDPYGNAGQWLATNILYIRLGSDDKSVPGFSNQRMNFSQGMIVDVTLPDPSPPDYSYRCVYKENVLRPWRFDNTCVLLSINDTNAQCMCYHASAIAVQSTPTCLPTTCWEAFWQYQWLDCGNAPCFGSYSLLDLFFTCSNYGDGCGGDIWCGSCDPGHIPVQACSPNGCVNENTMWGTIMKQNACVDQCGWTMLASGGSIKCDCPAGKYCERGQCLTCNVNTCSGKSCGVWPDGCGGSLHCGTCAGGQHCNSAGSCVSGACTQSTCSSGQCGAVSDGCGAYIDCGGCSGASKCVSNTCTQPCLTCWDLVNLQWEQDSCPCWDTSDTLVTLETLQCAAYNDGCGNTVRYSTEQ